MLIVPTCQQAALDLVKTGEKVDVEKDRLLERVRVAMAHCKGCICSVQYTSTHTMPLIPTGACSWQTPLAAAANMWFLFTRRHCFPANCLQLLQAHLPSPPHHSLMSLTQFMEWAKCVCNKLIAQGYWSDYIDPCSGLPVSSRPALPCHNQSHQHSSKPAQQPDHYGVVAGILCRRCARPGSCMCMLAVPPASIGSSGVTAAHRHAATGACEPPLWDDCVMGCV